MLRETVLSALKQSLAKTRISIIYGGDHFIALEPYLEEWGLLCIETTWVPVVYGSSRVGS